MIVERKIKTSNDNKPIRISTNSGMFLFSLFSKVTNLLNNSSLKDYWDNM